MFPEENENNDDELIFGNLTKNKTESKKKGENHTFF